MVGRALSQSSESPSLPDQVGTWSVDKSSGELPVERPFDMHRFRALFPDTWCTFLRAHFRNSVEIAHFFDVDDRTARTWLEGTTKPTAPTALIAVARIPGALAELMGRAA